MAKFKKGDIIEWTGCIARVEGVAPDDIRPKYILKWLFLDTYTLEKHEKLDEIPNITFTDHNAKLASENFQILYGNL